MYDLDIVTMEISTNSRLDNTLMVQCMPIIESINVYVGVFKFISVIVYAFISIE